MELFFFLHDPSNQSECHLTIRFMLCHSVHVRIRLIPIGAIAISDLFGTSGAIFSSLIVSRTLSAGGFDTGELVLWSVSFHIETESFVFGSNVYQPDFVIHKLRFHVNKLGGNVQHLVVGIFFIDYENKSTKFSRSLGQFTLQYYLGQHYYH